MVALSSGYLSVPFFIMEHLIFINIEHLDEVQISQITSEVMLQVDSHTKK